MEERNFEELVDKYLHDLWDAAMDDQISLALSRAVESFRRNRAETFKLYPGTEEKAKKLKEVKEHSLLNIDDLAKEVKDRVEDQHGNCIIAKTVGTPGSPVTFSSAIRRSAAAGKANDRSSTRVPPNLKTMSNW